MLRLARLVSIILSASVVLPLLGCVEQDATEQQFVLYYEIDRQDLVEEIIPPKVKVADVPTPPVVVTKKAEPKPQPKVSSAETNANEMYTLLLRTMNDRGLLVDDISGGDDRLRTIRKFLAEKDFQTATNLMKSFEFDIKRIKINEQFITEKNERLLGFIQEIKPSEAVLNRIDQESEQINQLLEREDYKTINLRMNGLFKLLRVR